MAHAKGVELTGAAPQELACTADWIWRAEVDASVIVPNCMVKGGLGALTAAIANAAREIVNALR